MRIAVIGTGIAGLAAARLLHRGHELTVFEAQERIGGHCHTVDVPGPDGPQPVDTGFMFYNDEHYPGFARLLALLGVPTRPVETSFSVSCGRTGIEYSPRSLDALFAQRANLISPRFYRLLFESWRFVRAAKRLLAGPSRETSIAEFMKTARLSKLFVDAYLLPMLSAAWSYEAGGLLDRPARDYFAFLQNHGMLDMLSPPQWRTIAGGSAVYIDALAAPFRSRIRTATPVTAVRREAAGVAVACARGEVQHFDHVVMALPAHRALGVLEGAHDAELRMLRAAAYARNDVALHRDAAILPASARAHATWNYRIPAGARAASCITYDVNRLHARRAAQPLLLTLNGMIQVRPDTVIRRLQFDHPTRCLGWRGTGAPGREAGHGPAIHYCGAYMGHGFHEDGLRSALEVAARFGRSFDDLR